MRTLFIVLATSGFALAQPLRSPEVHPDGRVTFRIRAPMAQELVVRVEGIGELRLTRDQQGIWSGTTGPLQPDFYAYSFSVDGLQVIDPANPLLKYNLLNTESLLHVPGQGLPWEIQDVPHGTVHRHLYRSGIAEDQRPYVVYTPAGFDPRSGPYPVLFLLHGYSDSEEAWVTVGRANIILDNLIGTGRAKPMVVVMPLGYGNRQVIEGGWQGLRNRQIWEDSIEKFRRILLEEIIDQVTGFYNLRTDPAGRAIAGLSMGGTQSLLVGLNALDRFAWIGAFSSGGLGEDLERQFPKLDKSADEKIRLLWISCGKQDGLFGANQRLVDWLKEKGVKFQWIATEGGHSFTVWRRNLVAFAQQLFK
ncbi:MAG: alpha/beta hydrolase-fold protein [Sedimentisphaerales bacterium]|nr:alpha/beta hydrolase-fold protein [Sedimentisphaerales bacterium]